MVSPWLSLYRRSPVMSRRSRRVAVAAAFLGYPLLLIGYGLLVEPGRISSLLWAPIAIALFAATLVGAVAIYGYGQGRMDRRARPTCSTAATRACSDRSTSSRQPMRH